jgi:hypothetical protein
LKRLSVGEWFTSRGTSAALYPAVYAKVTPAIQDDLRKGFSALSSDDTPMVRRAAAKWLGVRIMYCLTTFKSMIRPIYDAAIVDSFLKATYFVRRFADLP